MCWEKANDVMFPVFQPTFQLLQEGRARGKHFTLQGLGRCSRSTMTVMAFLAPPRQPGLAFPAASPSMGSPSPQDEWEAAFPALCPALVGLAAQQARALCLGTAPCPKFAERCLNWFSFQQESPWHSLRLNSLSHFNQWDGKTPKQECISKSDFFFFFFFSISSLTSPA